MPNTKGPLMIVAGTRPEAIKLAPVIWNLDKLGVDYVFIWSGQHYDYEMSRIFFEQLKLPEPDLNLDVKSGTHAEQTARIMIGVEKAIDKYKPSIVIAQGDTNTTLATALASIKKLVPFAHVEAGLRSWDRTMPEEINRIVADAVAELHFAPTELAAINLMHEGIPLRKIHITGNTIVDVVLKYKNYAIKEGEKILNKLGLEPQKYILVTIHRQENTDNPHRLKNIVEALIELSKHYPIIFPIHPRTAHRLKIYGLWNAISSQKNIYLLKPLGYFQFLGLLAKTLIVLTDSGGVQEEACTLKIPTITLRYNTERPETVQIGINKIVGTESSAIIYETLESIKRLDETKEKVKNKPNPLGDGNAGERISQILKKQLRNGIGISSFNGRSTSYVAYTLKMNTNNERERYNIIALYDTNGMATADISKAKWLVVKVPYKKINVSY